MEDPSAEPEDAATVLAVRAAEIEARLSEIETSSVKAASGFGFGKRIGEGTNIAVERFADVARHDDLQAELAVVRRAQEKLADGSAGVCDGCGGPIPEARREAIAWAVRCVNCA
ncbi:MAG: TraR/DksA C4-type zinc finger protein [Aquihabitans sp.]